MTNSNLLAPLPVDEWDDAIQHIADRLQNPLNIHKLIAHNPALMEAYTPLRYHAVRDSSLTDRQREILILRVAHQIQSEYEWRHHVARGRAAGLADGEIERVKQGAQADGWSIDERYIIACVDQILDKQQLDGDTAAGLIESIGKEGLLDAVFTVAVYIALGSLLNTFDVPID